MIIRYGARRGSICGYSNHDDSTEHKSRGLERFSSRSCAFRRTHTSTDPIRLFCIRLALPLTLSLPSRFAPSTKLMVGVSPRALWLAGAFSRDCTFWDCRGGVITINRQLVGPLVSTAAITTATYINHVDSGKFSSRCCTFRRTHTSADPIRILCIRLALTLTLSRPPGFASCTRLMICVSPRALRLVGDFSCDCMFWDDRGGGLTGQPMGPQEGFSFFFHEPKHPQKHPTLV